MKIWIIALVVIGSSFWQSLHAASLNFRDLGTGDSFYFLTDTAHKFLWTKTSNTTTQNTVNHTTAAIGVLVALETAWTADLPRIGWPRTELTKIALRSDSHSHSESGRFLGE
jgi:hypothetical protein